MLMRIHLGSKGKEIIENNHYISKANYRSRKNYIIESAILEKRLICNNSLLSTNHIIHNLTNLQSCYDR